MGFISWMRLDELDLSGLRSNKPIYNSRTNFNEQEEKEKDEKKTCRLCLNISDQHVRD